MFDAFESFSILTVFYGIGLISAAVLVLQGFLLMFGFDIDIETDFDAGAEVDDESVGLWSLRALSAFFFAFGWTGVTLREQDVNLAVTLLVSLGAGALLYLIVAVIMRFYTRNLEEQGNVDYSNAVGLVASVHQAVPAKRNGMGKIEVPVQGRLQIVDAITNDRKPLATQTKVTVVGKVDSTTLLVTKY